MQEDGVGGLLIGYCTRLRIIDLHGLTDRDVSRRPVAERIRCPGHEKQATSTDLIARRASLVGQYVYYPAERTALVSVQIPGFQPSAWQRP